MHIETICMDTVSTVFYIVAEVLTWPMLSMFGIKRIACYIFKSKLCTYLFNCTLILLY